MKVQYPGVAQAVRSDLQNLGMIMRVAKKIAPGMDAKAMTAEIKERLSDELDYEQEAQAQRAFARALRGHPFVVIPDVVTSLSREKVLVTEWVEGIGFEEVRELPEAERDRYGEIVFRFFFGSMHRNAHFSGDPHPGNFRFMDDGRIAFLDFGMTKVVHREHVENEAEVLRLGMEGDAQGLFDQLAAMGFFDPEDPVMQPDKVLEHIPGGDQLVRARPRGDDRPRRGGPGADRLRRPALGVLGDDPPRDPAARGHPGPAHGGPDPRRAGPPGLHRQLAPDLARVALRRPAHHAAGRAGGRVLRPRPAVA